MDPRSSVEAIQFTKIMQQQIQELHKVCAKKCIPSYTSNNVSRSEEVCLDRCVTKFYETTNMLTKFMGSGIIK